MNTSMPNDPQFNKHLQCLKLAGLQPKTIEAYSRAIRRIGNYLVTFTLPKRLRNLAWRHQKIVYSIMFDCVQDTLKTFTKNDKKLLGTAGFTAILHTHSRELGHHPHIHVVMPGASINMLTGLWKKQTGYLFNERALAKVFRAKMLATATRP